MLLEHTAAWSKSTKHKGIHLSEIEHSKISFHDKWLIICLYMHRLYHLYQCIFFHPCLLKSPERVLVHTVQGQKTETKEKEGRPLHKSSHLCSAQCEDESVSPLLSGCNHVRHYCHLDLTWLLTLSSTKQNHQIHN